MAPEYAYRAKLLSVVDGDTLKLDVDCGFDVHMHTTIRLIGLNTPEIFGVAKDSDTYKAGMAARDFVVAWFQKVQGGDVILHSTSTKGMQKEKYGRWLGKITGVVDGVEQVLNDELLRLGLAAPLVM